LGEISVVNDNRFDQILGDVWRKVEGRKTGVLHETISILDKQNARDICKFFEIKEDARITEDLQTLNQIKFLRNPSNNTPMKPIIEAHDLAQAKIDSAIEHSPDNILVQGVNFVRQNFTNHLEIASIISIALIAIALYTLKQGNRSSNQESSTANIIDNSKTDAVLCLAVPINRVDPELKKILVLESKLTVEEIKLLIDKSVYFIACEESKVDDYNRKALNLSGESIEYAEDGDVYIQMHIPTGEDIIGENVKGILSENLPDSKATIEDIAILNDLTNIDRFHRA
jgi:hypothetical protein